MLEVGNAKTSGGKSRVTRRVGEVAMADRRMGGRHAGFSGPLTKLISRVDPTHPITKAISLPTDQ